VYSCFFNGMSMNMKDLRISLSIWLALLTAIAMCANDFRILLNNTPMYFSFLVSASICDDWPFGRFIPYWNVVALFDHPRCIVLHFSTWNRSCHLSAQPPTRSRSHCGSSLSSSLCTLRNYFVDEGINYVREIIDITHKQNWSK
jgi:hypothetical protein